MKYNNKNYMKLYLFLVKFFFYNIYINPIKINYNQNLFIILK